MSQFNNVLPFQVPEDQWTEYIKLILLPMFFKDPMLHLGDLSCEDYLKQHGYIRDTYGEDKLFGSTLEIQFMEILTVYKISETKANIYINMKRYVQYLRNEGYCHLCPVVVMKYLLHSLSYVLTIPTEYIKIVDMYCQNYLNTYQILIQKEIKNSSMELTT